MAKKKLDWNPRVIQARKKGCLESRKAEDQGMYV